MLYTMGFIETLRKPKIPFTDFVLFDWAATFGAAYYLAQYYQQSFWFMFVCLIIASIVLHIIFDTPTVTNYYLGLSVYPPRGDAQMGPNYPETPI
jgi:hypothetical protein